MDAVHKKMLCATVAGGLFAVAWTSMFWISSVSGDERDDLDFVPWYWWLPLMLATVGWLMTILVRFGKSQMEELVFSRDEGENAKMCYVGTMVFFLFAPFILSVFLAMKNPGMYYSAVIVLQSTLVAFSSVIYAFASSIKATYT